MFCSHRCYRSALGIASILILAEFGYSQTSQPQLYVFSMPNCGPCREMEPNVDRLIRDGYPVVKIDCTAQPQWANQFQITQTPTTILVAGQRIVARNLGPMNYAELINLFNSVGYSPAKNKAADDSGAGLSSIASESAERDSPANVVNDRRADQPTLTAAQQRVLAATVRLRVDDPTGTSFGTGTVIHRHGDEYLAITCGHLFRESQGTGTVSVDLGFESGRPQTVRGELLDFNAQARDVGLVVFKTSREIAPVDVAPRILPIQAHDEVFSIGCNHGKAPTLRETQVIRTAIYDGAKKYDTVGRPVDGRSGGGLFSAGGQLIGICNAAAVEVDEGVFSSLDNIFWEFEKSHLAHLFQRESGSPTALAASQIQSETPSAGVSQTQVASDEALPSSGPVSPSTVNSDVELIVIVRSRSHPEQARTLSVADPSPELVSEIEAMSHTADVQSRVADNRRNFPTPTVPTGDTPTVRGQSWR